MSRHPRLQAVIDLFRAIAPAGLTIQQTAERLGFSYNTVTQLMSRAERGIARGVKLYKTRRGHSVVYFANECDAKAFDIKAYHAAQFVANGEARSPLQARIYRYLAGLPNGACSKDIAAYISESSGKSVAHVTTVVAEMNKIGRIVGIGPNNWKRYFAAEIAPDDAARAVILEQIEATRKANKLASRNHANERKKMTDAARRASRPKPAPKPAKVAKEKRRDGFMLSPKAPRPSVMLSNAAVRMLKRQIPDGPATIPDHVKVQVCPGYRGDVRYLPQTDRVIGGFATMGIGRYLEPEKVAA